MFFDPATLTLGPFGWFGGVPGQPLPHLGDRIARHTNGNAMGEKAERSAIRILNKGDFEMGLDMAQIVDRLFGGIDLL